VNQNPNMGQSVIHAPILSVAQEGHRKIGTCSAISQVVDATTEDLTTINHVSRTYREPNREMHNQRDWFASEHDTGSSDEPLKHDWRQTFSIGKVTDSAI